MRFLFHKFYCTTFICFFAICETSVAVVQPQPKLHHSVNELDYIDSIPVVLSATKLAQSIDVAPAAVTVITRRMIEASGAQEIGDLLRLVPGFQVGYFNGIFMSATYHGFSGNFDRRLQVLIDGRSVYMPLLSTVEWLSLPIDISEIEKIEVIRSSNAPVYGANSFKGVISIISRKPFQDAGTSIQFIAGSHDIGRSKHHLQNKEWRSLKNSIGSRKVIAKHADSNEGIDYSITTGYQEDPGFDEEADSKSLSLLRFVGGYQTTSTDRVDVQLGLRRGNMDNFADGSIADPDRNKAVESSYQSITWRSVLSADQELNIRIYHNYYEQDDEFTAIFGDILGNPPPQALPEPIRSLLDEQVELGIYSGIAERYDFEVQFNHTFSPFFRSVFSAGMRHDRLKSRYLLSENKVISDKSARVSLNLEWYLRSWLVLNSGVMVEKNEQIGTYTSPRLALNAKLTDSHAIRISATRATRTPSLLENNINLGCCWVGEVRPLVPIHVSKGNLRPEKLDTVELGYVFLPKSNGISFDTKIFWEKITDGILEASDEAQLANPWIWGNYTEAEVYGIESQLSYLGNQRFLFHFGHSHLIGDASWRRRINDDDISREFRDVSNSIPSHTLSLLSSYRAAPKFIWSFAYYLMTETNWLQDGSDLERQDRLDTKLAWVSKFSLERKIEVSLILQNILDDYVEIQNETVFEQRGFVAFKYAW